MRVVCFICGAALIFGPAALSAADSIDDARVTTRVETTLLLNDHLNVFDIRANSVDGRVTLRGRVPDDIQRNLAGDVVASVEGVNSVDNRIGVEPGVAFEGDVVSERTFRQRVEDRGVSASVRTRLVYNRHFRGLKIGVRTIDNVVTLSGIVPDESSRVNIARITAETRGVAGVINGLRVLPKREVSEPRDVAQVISDEWVEKRVETSILLHKNLSILHIDVEVNDGICVLSGAVFSEERKVQVGAVAAEVHGVLRLVNDIVVAGEQVPVLTVLDESGGVGEAPGAGLVLEPIELPDGSEVVIEPLDF